MYKKGNLMQLNYNDLFNIKTSFYLKNFRTNEEGEKFTNVVMLFFHTMHCINTNTEFRENLSQLKITKEDISANYLYIFNNLIDKILPNVTNDDLYSCFPTIQNQLTNLLNTPSVSRNELKFCCQKTMNKILEIIAKRKGVCILDHQFKIRETEIKNHQVQVSSLPDFNCDYFALYRLHETKAANWLFGKTDCPLYYESGEEFYKTFINEYGYTMEFEPRHNDMIVYLDNSKMPTHFGIFADSKKVYSKWGPHLSQIFLHDIDFVPAAYGSSYLILRKPET